MRTETVTPTKKAKMPPPKAAESTPPMKKAEVEKRLEELKAEYIGLEMGLGRVRLETRWKQGKVLAEARALPWFPNRNGGARVKGEAPWSAWVEENLPVAIETARDYLLLGEMQQGDLTLLIKRFSEGRKPSTPPPGLSIMKSAIAAMNRGATPDEAADEVIKERADKAKAEKAAATKTEKQTEALKEALRMGTHRAWTEAESTDFKKRFGKDLHDMYVKTKANTAYTGQTFQGTGSHTASPSGNGAMTRENALREIGITGFNVNVTPETLDIIFRGLKQKRHPDKGGAHDSFIRLTQAEEILHATVN